jgi:hypothetical protein
VTTGRVKCAYCNTGALPSEMEIITIGGVRRVTCPCYRRFEEGELERFQQWLRALPLGSAFLVIQQ